MKLGDGLLTLWDLRTTTARGQVHGRRVPALVPSLSVPSLAPVSSVMWAESVTAVLLHQFQA